MIKTLFWECSINLVAARRSSGNDGSNSIVREVCTMENTQPMKAENGQGSPADTLDASTKSRLVAATESAVSGNSSAGTTATTQNASPKTWTKQALEELKLKAGLVAGAIADFQAAGGLVAVKNVDTPLPSGSVMTAVKIYLVAEGLNLRVLHTPDGLDFDVLPLPSGSSGSDLVAGDNEAN